MARKFNYERAASALLEALLGGDQTAAEKYGVSIRSIQTWRQRLGEDAHLVEFFAIKRRAFEDGWAEELGVPIRAAARLITEAAASADAVTKRNPEFIHAIAGALKICAELKIVSKVIDARTAPRDGVPGSAQAPANSYTN